MLHLPLWFGSNPLVDSRDRVKGRRNWPSKGELGCSVYAWWTVREARADNPWGVDSPAARHVLRLFLRVFHSIHLVGWFSVHEVHGRSVLECQTVHDEANGPQVHHGWSIFLSALLKVRVAFSDGLPPTHRQSACAPQTVHHPLADGPPSSSQIA
jgi:hypothetical protein